MTHHLCHSCGLSIETKTDNFALTPKGHQCWWCYTDTWQESEYEEPKGGAIILTYLTALLALAAVAVISYGCWASAPY